MPINPVWPKPYKWLVDPRLVHPGQRWVWHTKPRFIMPLWEDVRPGTAQRYRRLRYVVVGAGSARPIQVLGARAARAPLDQERDAVALIPTPLRRG